ncbi:MAG TPA: methyltransferase domain-containing protein [Candidatus Binatia bacterium]|nr:methyltransferase domain-containing protein [Candidatus Binatia bacterium]
MNDCCGTVNTFSSKEAENDLKRFREHGAEGVTRSLIEAIKAEGVAGATLLDVGGGVGAIQLELLAAGLARAESVDATEAYVEAARREAARRGFADRTFHRFGTLVDLAATVAPADIVTLDKVVCCDPNVSALLGAVAAKARRVVGLIYPRVTWWNRIAARALAAWGWIARDSTRWHLHADAQVDGLLRAAGFERRDVDRTLIWQVALYVRPAAESRR